MAQQELISSEGSAKVERQCEKMNSDG